MTHDCGDLASYVGLPCPSRLPTYARYRDLWSRGASFTKIRPGRVHRFAGLAGAADREPHSEGLRPQTCISHSSGG